VTEAQLIQAIRNGIIEPQPKTVSNASISTWIADAVRALGLEIKGRDSRYFEKSALLSSYTNVFARPSDCQTILRVWDIRTRAKAITGATNASPIVITAVGHGLSTDDIVFIAGVLGNTAANGTWKITVVSDDSFSLTGSAGLGEGYDYTSGGLVAKWPGSGDDQHIPLAQIPPSHSSLDDDSRWFVRSKQIVVDDIGFENDLLLEHTYSPSSIDDIPEEYHAGLVAWPVMNLIRIPKPEDSNYEDVLKQRQYYAAEWKRVLGAIQGITMATHLNHQLPKTGGIGAL